jgi:hypothetical protein
LTGSLDIFLKGQQATGNRQQIDLIFTFARGILFLTFHGILGGGGSQILFALRVNTQNVPRRINQPEFDITNKSR